MIDDDEDDDGNNNEHLLLPNASLEHDRDGGEGRGVSVGPVGGPSRPGDGSAVLRDLYKLIKVCRWTVTREKLKRKLTRFCIS